VLRRISGEQKRSATHWAMEFVVVVAGVLLALWLQQWDQRRRELAGMRAAEVAIHDEVRGTLTSLIWREAISKCHYERAELLQSRLLAKDSQWQGLDENALFTDIGKLPGSVSRSVYHRPIDSFTDSAWTTALTTGALAPMDRERFAKLVEAYDSIRYLQRTRDLEDQAASKLSPLGFSVQLTPQMRSDMLSAVYDIDRSRFIFAYINPNYFSTIMRQLGWDDAAEIDRYIVENRRGAAQSGMKFRPCVAQERNPFRASGQPR
jgi:hypothetical protein